MLITQDNTTALEQAHRLRDEKYKQDKAEIHRVLTEGLADGETWFFWCLKGRSFNPYTKEPDGWEWPPRLSGRIAATSKAEAKKAIEQEMGEEFPMRVLRKNQSQYPFLLYIEPMIPGGSGERYGRRFILRQCQECNVAFTLNDKYNDPMANSSQETCSAECETRMRNRERAEGFGQQASGNSPPVIYCITHTPSGQRYVGKTEQPFTLRWYQHMYHPGDSAFHSKISSTPITEWQFEILEHLGHLIIAHPDRRNPAYRAAIAAREQYWINHFDSLNNGLNSVKACTLSDDGSLNASGNTEEGTDECA